MARHRLAEAAHGLCWHTAATDAKHTAKKDLLRATKRYSDAFSKQLSALNEIMCLRMCVCGWGGDRVASASVA